ncbi:Undecaprenyl phosphate-alpha-4-amino-4-deoxy-L-arabinose arabinosyl transferase [Roseovarius gaetbuli]|uniref:Undecaprenyl phosphate-alpha-4-amino-4-deoxy-L-arabinose arabinosyl transferase n=1 Tax=Roseovarius gaetbuli TaxID=1356575 RepID=A0A1X6ZT64_9RHOB|nr:glycosyltransferase family 39 protein [Roseovarius gaetbuli]SLN60988.1 Undecaprenyl phosphate-alpha-4-amino-4-deoxy-L-arabinose arabinosyl transferase [Roseovarius gaetbuli]
MSDPLKAQATSGAPQRYIVLLVVGTLFVLDVLMRPMMPTNETRYLSVAWEMLTGNHWLVPFKNGVSYSQKPPLLFWLINLVWLPGVTEYGARLVAPALSLLALWLTGRLADRMRPGGDFGNAAIAVLGTMVPFYFFAGETNFDGILMLAMVTCAAALWRIGATPEPRLLNWLVFGAALGFGVYAKGPVIFVHVMPLLLGMRWWAGAGRFSIAGSLAALAVAIILVALWLVPAYVTGDAAYREATLWTQSAGRVVNSFAHARPVWYYLGILPMLLFPWIAIRGFWQVRPLDNAEKFAWLWLLGPFILFSLISGKQPAYLLPAMPAAALLLANRWPERIGKPWIVADVLVIAMITLLVMPSGALGASIADFLDLRLAIVVLIPLALVVAGMMRRPGLVWLAVPAIGLALNLAYFIGPAGKIMSPVEIATILAEKDGRIGHAGPDYHGDFHFAGRLRAPLTLLPDQAAIAAFAKKNPDGLIVGRLTEGVRPDWAPQNTVRYRKKGTWAVWNIEEMTQ